MKTRIILAERTPVLSAGLVKGEKSFLFLSFDNSASGGKDFIRLLSREEAFALWNFLDEALEIPF